MLCLQPKLVLKENDSSKLGSIVLNVEAVLLALDDCVAPTHTDVVDSHLALMPSSKLELRLLGGNCEQMDVSGSVLVQRHRLKQNIVVVAGHLLRKINDLVYRPLDFEGVGIHLLAYLAFETLPVEGTDVLVLSIWWLLLLLG
jgi:hypothetical protein